MFDIKQAYVRALMDMDEFNRSGEKNDAIRQSYQTLLNVISNDIRFRATSYIQATHNED